MQLSDCIPVIAARLQFGFWVGRDGFWLRRLQRGCSQLLNAAFIGLKNDKVEPININVVLRGRNAPHSIAQEPANGAIVVEVVLGELQARGLADAIQLGQAIDQERAVRLLLYGCGVCVGIVVFIINLADHLFQDVFESDQAGRAAILVHDDSQMQSASAHLFQRTPGRHGLGDKEGWIGDLGDLDGVQVHIRSSKKLQEGLGVDDAANVVDRLRVYRQTGKVTIVLGQQKVAQGGGLVECDNVDAGAHDRADFCLLEVEDVIDEVTLVALDRTGLVCTGDNQAELRFRDFCLGLDGEVEEGHDATEKPDKNAADWVKDDSKNVDDRETGAENCLGVVDAQGFGENFAKKEVKECQKGCDVADARGAEYGGGCLGGEGGCGDGGDLNGDKNGGEEACDVAIEDGKDGPLALCGGELADFPREQGSNCGFGCGEDGRAEEED
mmetsp:Transcript_15963/g.39501  ORF Transcript_15963/g.39501 Transcript_15963/m.39501 type:complete len:441 (-) Transcript_15963:420-1742(-)